LPEIAERLQYAPPAPTREVVARRPPASQQKAPRQYLYALPALAFIVLLIALVGGVKLLLFDRPSSPPTARGALEQPKPSAPAPLAGIEQSSPPLSRDENKPAMVPPKAQSSARAALKTASEVRNLPPRSLETRAATGRTDSVPQEVIQQVLPDVPRSATSTIRGTVRVTVRVRVDPAGNVSGVTFVSAGPSQYFARLALDAARKWKFSPARRDGQTIASAWTVRFEFNPGGTRVVPVAVP
jgi:protein TonB